MEHATAAEQAAMFARWRARNGHRAPEPEPEPRKKYRHGSLFLCPERDYVPLKDRNARVRLWAWARSYDRDTHVRGWHGGSLKPSGLLVLHSLLFDFHNVASGRCDPSLDRIAQRTNLARSTVVEALKRLEAAGIVRHVRRIARVPVRLPNGRVMRHTRQVSNAYVFFPPRSESGYRSETETKNIKGIQVDGAPAQQPADSARTARGPDPPGDRAQPGEYG